MEKLIELLNEFGKERQTQLNRPIFIKDRDNQSILISKQFGFIQRLVENNKIDTQNLITYINGTSLTFNKVPSTDCAGIEKTWNKFYTECLLMLLAISDTPVEDLISYLK